MTGRYKAYPEYKESGVEWLDCLPLHWGAVALKMLIDVRDGTHDTPSYVESSESSYPLVTSKDVTGGKINLPSCKQISEEDYNSIIKRSAVSVGDILMPMIGTVGSPILIDNDPNIAIKNLALFKTSEERSQIETRYLLYFLNSNECSLQFSLESRGGVQNFVSLGTLRNLGLPLLTLREQQEIANFLDHETAKIDTLITKQEKLIELLKEKRQAVISHAVTKGLNPGAPMKDSGVEWLGEVPEHWDVIFIKHLSQVKRGASPRPIDDPKYFDDNGEYSWTRIADVSSAGMYLTSTTQRLSSLGSSLSVRLGANELFLSIAGTVGKPCITVSNACIHDGFVYFPTLDINNKFLYYIFDAGQAYLGLGKMGTQLNLNTDTVGGIKIGLPPKNEIEEIIGDIEYQNVKYDRLIDRAVDSIELMRERKTALISATVTGKIDVRDYDNVKQVG